MADVSPSVAACMSDMAAEILDLRARLAEVEAERDQERENYEMANTAAHKILTRAQAAEARLAEVEAERDAAEFHLADAREENQKLADRLAAVLAECDYRDEDEDYASDFMQGVLYARREIRAVAAGDDRG